MSKVVELKKHPKKVHAIELLVNEPDITNKELAKRLHVTDITITRWRQDPNFVDAYYNRYMVEFGMDIPSVLKAMIREAQAGNVQAGRLVLEHSGKLVKNVNITIDSPFEKFLKAVPDAEIVEDSEVLDIVASVDIDSSELPPRNKESQQLRVHKERVACKDVIKKEEYNKKQREWHRWRKRAKGVNIKPLKGRRPTPAQRKDWEESIIEAESTNTH